MRQRARGDRATMRIILLQSEMTIQTQMTPKLNSHEWCHTVVCGLTIWIPWVPSVPNNSAVRDAFASGSVRHWYS